MIQAKDLMIGDWVNYRPAWKNEETGEIEYESKTGFPIRITSIYDELCQYDDTLPDGTINTIEVADYELSQIPLTPEILDKNGFESDDNMFGLEDYELSKEFFLENRGDRFCISRRICNHQSTFFVLELHYVHQLQHCIRLFGIDLEIKL